MGEEIQDELTYKIIGCAMKVHSTLGNGFQELIYQRALAVEFEKQGIRFAREDIIGRCSSRSRIELLGSIQTRKGFVNQFWSS